jgi:hypothetical protein
MSTTLESPVREGEWFEVTSYCDPEAEQRHLGRRLRAVWVGKYHIQASGVDTMFSFCEVRRVEPTEQERACENFLLEDGNAAV